LMMRLVSWPRHSRARGMGVVFVVPRFFLPPVCYCWGYAFFGPLPPCAQRKRTCEQRENQESRGECVFHHSSLLMVNMKLRGYCKAQSVGIEGNGSLLRRFHLIVTAVCT